MTEAEWLAAADPDRLLSCLAICLEKYEGEAVIDYPGVPWVNRKLRLWAIGCCRRIERLLAPQSRSGLEAVERHLDGELGQKELQAAFGAAAQVAEDMQEANAPGNMSSAAWAVRSAMDDVNYEFDERREAAAFAASAVVAEVSGNTLTGSELARTARAAEERAQAELVRDIFGNPFRPVALEPAWLTSDVRALAHAIYAERALDRMPILADALQEAGCDNEDVLAHCRSATAPHVRGCWVVDLLMGKGGPTIA